jgi:hypothetical protein
MKDNPKLLLVAQVKPDEWQFVVDEAKRLGLSRAYVIRQGIKRLMGRPPAKKAARKRNLARCA